MQNQYSLSQIYAPIDAVMGAVRESVLDVWRDTLTLTPATDANAHTQQAEGKLLRPALCLLGAGALGAPDLERYAPLAAAYELMHIASLTHDDVVDHASVRRGQNSLNVLWSDHAAILGGDYLVARALELLIAYDSSRLIAGALRAMRRMAEGELRYFGRTGQTLDETDCIALADNKTASLFAAACAAPALLIAPEQAQLLHDFGIALGIAFQLVDDLLDVTQSAETLGKPACGDVTEDKHTLPLLMLRQGLDDAEQQLLDAMTGRVLSEAEQAWIRDAVIRLGVDRATTARATEYVDRALAALAVLPDSPCRESMTQLAQFVLVRQA